MVKEAEKYKEEDDVQRDKVSSKNGLESYAFNMKSTVEDEKLAGKISDDDKQKILDKCNEVISWLDKNQVNIMPLFDLFYDTIAKKTKLFLFCRLPRRRNMSISRRSSRRCVAQSSPNCTRVLECLVTCLRVCLVASPVHLVVLLLVVPLDQPLRRSTKHSIFLSYRTSNLRKFTLLQHMLDGKQA